MSSISPLSIQQGFLADKAFLGWPQKLQQVYFDLIPDLMTLTQEAWEKPVGLVNFINLKSHVMYMLLTPEFCTKFAQNAYGSWKMGYTDKGFASELYKMARRDLLGFAYMAKFPEKAVRDMGVSSEEQFLHRFFRVPLKVAGSGSIIGELVREAPMSLCVIDGVDAPF